MAVPFIRIGLERKEKCVYITDAPGMDRVRAALAAGGIDVDGAVAAGALVLATKDETLVAGALRSTFSSTVGAVPAVQRVHGQAPYSETSESSKLHGMRGLDLVPGAGIEPALPSPGNGF